MHLLLFFAIITIALIQLVIFLFTRSRILGYRATFQGIHFKLKKRPDPESEEIEIPCIDTQDKVEHPLLKKIIDSINTYLLKNRGAVSDFLLVKDIVERNLDTKREEFHVQIPVPLYLGLMGTMLGIIIGVASVDLNALSSANGTSSIKELMAGVAIAMSASFLGLLFTTINSWLAKDAESTVEDDKNEFYTWIQTQLLPHLGGMGNTLATLQQNLIEFNRTFSINTAKLDKALEKVGDSYQEQTELLQTIQELDIRKMATANVKVLHELQATAPQLERFTQYMGKLNDFVTSAGQLNAVLNSQLGNVQLIGEMAAFFQREAKAFDQREEAIRHAVGTVDDLLQKTFNDLGEHAGQSMQKANQALIQKQEEFKSALNFQQDTMQQHLQNANHILEKMGDRAVEGIQKMNEALLQKQDAFTETLQAQQTVWIQKLQETNNVFEELRNLSAVKDALNQQTEQADRQLQALQTLQQSIAEQSAQMLSLTKSIETQTAQITTLVHTTENMTKTLRKSPSPAHASRPKKKPAIKKLSGMFSRLFTAKGSEKKHLEMPSSLPKTGKEDTGSSQTAEQV